MNDSRTLPALVPDTHPEYLLPAFPINHLLTAMSGHSSDEIADALSEALMLFGEALAEGTRHPDSGTRLTLYILRKLYRAFHKTETDLELLNSRLERQSATSTGMFSAEAGEIPD